MKNKLGNLTFLQKEESYNLMQRVFSLESEIDSLKEMPRVINQVKKKTKYAFTLDDESHLIYMGEIENQSENTVTIRCWSAMSLLLIGRIEDSGELITQPISKTRIFIDRESMLFVAAPILNNQNKFRK